MDDVFQGRLSGTNVQFKEDSFAVRGKLRLMTGERLDGVLTVRHNRDRNDGLVLAPVNAATLEPILGTN